ARHGLVDYGDAIGSRVVVIGEEAPGVERLFHSFEIFRRYERDIDERGEFTLGNRPPLDLEAVGARTVRDARGVKWNIGGERRRLDSCDFTGAAEYVAGEFVELFCLAVLRKIRAQPHRQQTVGIEAWIDLLQSQKTPNHEARADQ